MRLSSNLRRYRWAVFAVWLLLLAPAIYLGLNQSGNLTGGGFEVAGSQSLHVQTELESTSPTRAHRRWRWSPRRGPTRRSTT